MGAAGIHSDAWLANVKALLRRDGKKCWLCREPIDLDAPFNDPYAPTLDHVTPQARGGKTVLENLRLAHFRCNSAREKLFPETLIA